MASALALDRYRPDIGRATDTVFETALGLEISRLRSYPNDEPGEFTASVYYTGSWRGALVLECSTAQAEDWVSRLMSKPPPVPFEEMRDGLGQIASILASQLIEGLPPGMQLSVPSVAEGADYSLRICGGNLFETLNFEDELGAFRVTFVKAT